CARAIALYRRATQGSPPRRPLAKKSVASASIPELSARPRAEDLPRGSLLHQRDEGDTARVPRSVHRDGRFTLVGRAGHGADADELSHHRGVRERAPAVFAGRDARPEAALRDGNPDLTRVLRDGNVGRTDVHYGALPPDGDAGGVLA